LLFDDDFELKSRFLWTENMLRLELQAFVSELYRLWEQSSPTQFKTWHKLWVAANGHLGRKKQVENAVLSALLGKPSSASVDPYGFIFAVECALVYLGAETLKAYGGKSEDTVLADLFSWWGPYADEKFHTASLKISSVLKEKVEQDPHGFVASDPFRVFYHELLPKAVRHTLGAYLTPPDLCAYVLDGVGIDEIWNSPGIKRILEPNCGLGAFLSAIYSKGDLAVTGGHISRKKLCQVFKNQVFGVEKNLASCVISKYLFLSILAVLGDKDGCADNIICADSVFLDARSISPALRESLFDDEEERVVPVGAFRLSMSADVDKNGNPGLGDIFVLELFNGERWELVGKKYKEIEDQLSLSDALITAKLVEEAKSLDCLGRFEVIVGNPPWVNWEYIDPDYRDLLLPAWPELGLFAMAGRDRAFSKEDLSVFATYSVLFRFGCPSAKMGFLLPQSVFQSRKNSKGFRRFRLGSNGLHIKVEKVVDFSDYAAFGDAKNRTAALFCSLGNDVTSFPVQYLVFEPNKRDGSVHDGAFLKMRAYPSSRDDASSNWALYEEAEIASDNVRIVSTYKARTGVFTGGANAVFYVKVLDPNGQTVKVMNDTERAKIKVPTQEFFVEKEFLFPFARGRDLGFWRVERASENGILLAHSEKSRIKPLSPTHVKSVAPLTYQYLAQYEGLLATRASLTALDKANVAEGFYALLRVGDYTFAPYKVAWKYISRTFCCAVVESALMAGVLKPTILQEKLISIPFWEEMEAYFVCGFLSSTSVRKEVERRIVGTQVSAHVIEDIHIPRFDPKNRLHMEIAELCRQGHRSDDPAYELSLIDEKVALV
jgi:hypothetical protein